MRSMIVILLAVAACGKGENAGAAEAEKEAEREQKEKAQTVAPAKKVLPPVPGRAHVPCTQVIDIPKFAQGLGETETMTLQESKSEPEAAASCSLIRGGKKLSDAEQKAAIKKNGKLGVLPGDEICNISTFCWTIEDAEKFKQRCHNVKTDKEDDSLGFTACVRIIAQGADDVKRFQFFDDDTKCVIQVRGGPSNVDNDLIGKCAKTAHDLIGPDQIKVGAAPAAPAGSGSGT